MTALIPQNFGAVSSKFAPAASGQENDLAAGVQAGYGLIGYRGKVWSVRYRGDEHRLMRDDGDGPRGSIEVVILKAAAHIAKIWYENGYVEGSSAAPDCFSSNGVTPDAASTKKQAPTCAACPKNAWGSRITPEGKQGKACSDSKRLAVTPLTDLQNAAFGGPMLLRVPAASLQDLANFGNRMQQLGYPYSSIGVRVSFDTEAAYPKFVFNAIRPLTDDEADTVISLQKSAVVGRILAEATEVQPKDGDTPEKAFEQPPATQAKDQTAAPQVTKAAAKAAPISSETAKNLDAQIDALLG